MEHSEAVIHNIWFSCLFMIDIFQVTQAAASTPLPQNQQSQQISIATPAGQAHPSAVQTQTGNLTSAGLKLIPFPILMMTIIAIDL